MRYAAVRCECLMFCGVISLYFRFGENVCNVCYEVVSSLFSERGV